MFAVPLEPPNLDDRTFDQIKSELLLRIPHYTPEWTDWNESDPGVTLIELFAWLAESIGYRLNQAPERCLLTFLDVLGITPAPAQPGETDLTFTMREGESRAVVVPMHTRVASDVQTEDGPIVFETEAEVELIPLRLQSIQVAGLSGFEVIPSAEVAGQSFRPFGRDPQIGNALYLGFGPANGQVNFPQQITFLIDPPSLPIPAPTNVRVQWEFRTSASSEQWSPLSLYEDGSRAFTRRGYVKLSGPRNSVAVPAVGKEPRPLHWIRCRLAGGRYEPGHEPVVDLFRCNTVAATSLSSVTRELAGQSDGRTSQIVQLRNRSVLASSVIVEIVDPAGTAPSPNDKPWTSVRDFVESGPLDPHFVVDPSRGELHFGDGRNGQVPVAGFDVVVSYRYGGTSMANVAKDAISGLQSAIGGIESVTNLRPAVNGRDEETNAELRRQAPSRLRTGDRAVTAEDYRQLTRKVGGVADAVAIPLRHPDHPGTEIPGCVMVAVLALSTERKPYATTELLAAVEQRLEDVRTIGTELFVRGARFVEVTVSVVVEADPYAAFGEIAIEVEKRINETLSPMQQRPVGGMGDAASRFGMDFFPTSLFGVIQPIAGVVAITSLDVKIDGAAHPDISASVTVEPDQLVVPAPQHDIIVRPRTDQ